MQTNSSQVFARVGFALVVGIFAVAASQSAGCSSDSGQPDAGPACTQGVAPDGGTGSCALGTVCTNAACVQTCDMSGAGCAPGFYCENITSPDFDAGNVCSPITTTDCQSDNDCPPQQACATGICSSIELRANGSAQGCNLGQVVDGCAPDSLCYQIPAAGQELNECIGLSHCSEDGGCPVDPTSIGATCNELADGGFLFAGKERLCLYGYCTVDTDCPVGEACFHRTLGDSLGQCQFGEIGDPCYTEDDCFNSAVGCLITLDGGVDGGEDDGGQLGICN